MKVRYNHWLPKKLKVVGITIYPYILFARPMNQITEKARKHELTHIEQVEDDGFFTFYVAYFVFYLGGLIRYKNHAKAYRNIPYEVEAYNIEYQGLSVEDKHRWANHD